MEHLITVLPQQKNIVAAHGTNLLAALRTAKLAPDAPCGGNGTCGKCRVTVDGEQILACRTTVLGDMTVVLPDTAQSRILTDGHIGIPAGIPEAEGYALALDIGTTTVVGYLLDRSTGETMACSSMRNPQTAYGADVISRIRYALRDSENRLTRVIRDAAQALTEDLCRAADISPDQLWVVTMVGNPAMQQLFLGISPENLTRIPFAPVLTEAKWVAAKDYLPIWENGELLIVPDVSGFVGADTVACVLSCGLDQQEEVCLLVDIGTNGEMVMGNRNRMVACSTAAGPALEGANIRCGMRGQTGAIDHVSLENGAIRCSVIGGGVAEGICGSGLVDAVAASLDAGLLNSRGRIQNAEHTLSLTDQVFLTQEDIREVQAAKGAIAAGIELMAAHLGISLEQIRQVYLAGAFGTYMDHRAACRIGLLPEVLSERITAVGNAAGSGAKLLACDPGEADHAQRLVSRIQFLELASIPDFQRCFARNMRF